MFDLAIRNGTLVTADRVFGGHLYVRNGTIAAISDALPDMDAAMRPLAEQTIHKLQNITDAAFEEAQFTMTLSDAE